MHPGLKPNNIGSMVRNIEAIFSQGAFRPLEPIAIAEGTRVQLSVVDEEKLTTGSSRPAKIRSPKLAHPELAVHFVMELPEKSCGFSER